MATHDHDHDHDHDHGAANQRGVVNGDFGSVDMLCNSRLDWSG